MIRIKLKEAIDELRDRTGEKVTYEQLAADTGLSKATIESIASRKHYNASLKVIDTLCLHLSTDPAQLLEYFPEKDMDSRED